MTDESEDFSKLFYPFLHTGEKSGAGVMKGLRHSLIVKARESAEVKQQFFETNQEKILQASLAMASAFQRGGKLLVCGNGGSATDAAHIAVEFMHPITMGRKALPAIALSNDIATVTALANDVGYADVFARQLIALGREGDILLGLSTSGNSDNLLRAFETAKRLKLVTIGFAGGDGGKMATSEAVDYCLTIPTSSIHRVQETQITLYHVIWDLTHEMLQHLSTLEEASRDEIR
jgi:D-sedoheptulose 7-phosphate isomerase